MKIGVVTLPGVASFDRVKRTSFIERFLPRSNISKSRRVGSLAYEFAVSGRADSAGEAQTLEDLADGLVYGFDPEDGSQASSCIVQRVKFDLTAEKYGEWPYTMTVVQRAIGTAPRFNALRFNPNRFNA